MADRFKAQDFSTFRSHAVQTAESGGVDSHNTVGYGRISNYHMAYYEPHNYCEWALSTAHTMEGELSSYRYRADVYNDDLVPAMKFDPYHQVLPGLPSYTASTNPFLYDNIPGNKGWTYDHYNRNVIFYRPHENLADFEKFKSYFLEKYGKHFLARGSYMKNPICVHDGAHLISSDEQPFYAYQRHQEPRKTAGAHPYHWYGAPLGGVWNQVVMDPVPSFYRGWNIDGIQNWPTPYPYHHESQEPSSNANYFDCMGRIYLYHSSPTQGAGIFGVMPAGYGNQECYFGPEWYYQETQSWDIDCVPWINNLIGAHHPTLGVSGNGTFSFGYGTHVFAKFGCEVVWATQDMHQYNIDNPGGDAWTDIGNVPTSHCDNMLNDHGGPNGSGIMPIRTWNWGESGMIPDRNTDSQHDCRMSFYTDAVDPGSNDFIYFAVRPLQVDWDTSEPAWGYPGNVYPDWDRRRFRQICIPVVSDANAQGKLPPHLKD